MIKESGMHCLTHDVISPERKGNIAYAPAYLCEREVLLDPAGSLNEVHRIVVMLLYACCDGKYIRVENNIIRWKADFFGEDAVRAFANLCFAPEAVCLSCFVKSHYYYGSSVHFNS
jgi:hypothetical protein